MTFLNEHTVQLLEWETTVSEYDHKYEYAIVDNNIILYSYMNEADYIDNDFEESHNEGRIEHSAMIEGDTIIFQEWLNGGERFVFHKRTDLSTDGDIIIISDTYFENMEYFVVMECKLLSNHYADIHLYVTSDKIDYGIGMNKERMSSVGARQGYNMIIYTFTKDELTRLEEDEFRKLLFEYTNTGSFTEQDRAKYLEENDYPALPDIWASMEYADDFLAESKTTKFK